jgi:hypothetical protein
MGAGGKSAQNGKAQQQQQEAGHNPLYTQATVVLLREDSVEVVLVQTGKVIHYLSTANLKEQILSEQSELPLYLTNAAAAGSKKGRKDNAGRNEPISLQAQVAMIRNSSKDLKRNRELEGKPSIVYWCAATHLVLVGFTSGSIGLLALSGAIHSTLGNNTLQAAHIPSNMQHGTEITKIITFHHKLVPKTAFSIVVPPKDVVVALVGDSSGMLSLWQIYPAV